MRNRLVGAVAVVAVAVLGAGAPGVMTAVDHTHTSQQLVDLAELNARAIALAHSLADERDAMTAYVADGRSSKSGAGVPEDQRARVDRQITELRAKSHGTAGESAVFTAADTLLTALPQTRQKALSGPGSAEDTFTAYTKAVQALGAISADIARGLPARANGADADTRALPALGRATDQAAATRGLLLAALGAGGPQSKLTTAAQLAHTREQGALADFAQSASAGARDRYDRTVNGTDVTNAENYLTRLTAQPRLDTADQAIGRDRVRAALTARVGLMRGVESAMATADIERLGGLRDDDVTALEIRIALAGLCLLVAVGAGVSAARSMTRPLAALRLGAQRVAADPSHEEPITFKGRNDEFAATVRSVNALHGKVGELAVRTGELEGERTRLVGGRQRLVAERDVLQDERVELKRELAARTAQLTELTGQLTDLTGQRAELTERLADLSERLTALRTGVHGQFVNLSLRTLGLVERQLGVIESLEESEADPERLETLFKLDHFAARMRRNSENLLVLAGAEHGSGHPGPVPLLDVLRASISEIERYQRVRVRSLPPHAQVAGFAADDISHLIAELLENATSFSPPEAYVELSGWLLETGEVMLSVQDEGIGMTAERMAELNARLADAPGAAAAETIDEALGLGLYVVVRLAARHGVRVQLREQEQGGIAAVVVLPGSILPAAPDPVGGPAHTAAGAAPSLPGSVAEANSNTLQTRMPRTDPATGRPDAGADDAPHTTDRTEPGGTDTGADTVADSGPGAGADSGADPAAGPAAAPAVLVEPAAPAVPVEPAAPQAPAPGPAPFDDSTIQLPVIAPDRDGGADTGQGTGPAPGRPFTPATDPIVAAAERAIDAAGLGAGPAGPTTHAAPDPSPYGPRSSGPYATGAAEHTRPEEATAPADAPAAQAPGGGRHAAPAGAARPPVRPAASDPYAVGPDQHSRPVTDAAPAPADVPADAPADAPEQGQRRTTVTGLPKRTPKVVAQQKPAAAPRKSGAAHAEALRRRLGGFQQGARDGRREVEAEIAERTAEQTIPQKDTDGAGAPGESHVVEEARD
ncbi:sensor histidine kinase [Streptomyces celluloflavus]|uniref:sensor histidine kinase n=1 Tax=Streptomyces celluloflavus TaxID=58344 RepID=UPI0034610E41|nr:nitrate- and nitrite sensing domain-containing protein [Streptomyces celluloflavus]